MPRQQMDIQTITPTQCLVACLNVSKCLHLDTQIAGREIEKSTTASQQHQCFNKVLVNSRISLNSFQQKALSSYHTVRCVDKKLVSIHSISSGREDMFVLNSKVVSTPDPLVIDKTQRRDGKLFSLFCLLMLFLIVIGIES